MFKTRHLRVLQSEGDSEQLCLIATADFHIDEPDDMVNYSARPQVKVPCSPPEETEVEETQEPGLYKNLDKFIEVRPHRAGKSGKQVPDLVSADRFRIHGPLYT
jgi:hypothetical protein